MQRGDVLGTQRGVELDKKRLGKRVDERHEAIRCTAIGHHRHGPVEVELRPVDHSVQVALEHVRHANVAVDEAAQARDLCLHEQLGAGSSGRGSETDETRPQRRVVNGAIVIANEARERVVLVGGVVDLVDDEERAVLQVELVDGEQIEEQIAGEDEHVAFDLARVHLLVLAAELAHTQRAATLRAHVCGLLEDERNAIAHEEDALVWIESAHVNGEHGGAHGLAGARRQEEDRVGSQAAQVELELICARHVERLIADVERRRFIRVVVDETRGRKLAPWRHARVALDASVEVVKRARLDVRQVVHLLGPLVLVVETGYLSIRVAHLNRLGLEAADGLLFGSDERARADLELARGAHEYLRRELVSLGVGRRLGGHQLLVQHALALLDLDDEMGAVARRLKEAQLLVARQIRVAHLARHSIVDHV